MHAMSADTPIKLPEAARVQEQQQKWPLYEI
jgi:hypothetical protein